MLKVGAMTVALSLVLGAFVITRMIKKVIIVIKQLEYYNYN